jgi:hypothetical protein
MVNLRQLPLNYKNAQNIWGAYLRSTRLYFNTLAGGRKLLEGYIWLNLIDRLYPVVRISVVVGCPTCGERTLGDSHEEEE